MGHAERTVILTAGAYNKFPNSARGVRLAVGILRGKAFVVVIVAVQNYIGVCIIKGLIQRFQLKRVSVFSARAEQRLVKICKLACTRMRCEVGPQPLLLPASSVATAHFQ